MATTKITKRDNFNSIIAILNEGGYSDLASVMEHEIELLDNKVGKKSSATLIAQNSFDSLVLDVMNATPSTVTEIYARMGKPDGVTAPKITASLKRLIADSKVQNSKDGKKSLYSLI